MAFQKPTIQTSLSVNEARDYKNKLAHLTNNMDDFLINKTKEHMNKIVIDEIQKRMEREKFSPKIIQNTYLKEVYITGEMVRAKVVSEYTSESGFDVAVAREKGTKDHMIKPTVKMALHWITAGVSLFSKGHMVSGLKSLNIIKNTIRDKSDEVKEAVEKDFQTWQDSVMK